jgi:HAD superfamily hydrolase (TIGR01509 family)
MIRAVIFDFNGVIVDDEALHCRLLRDVLGLQGIALSESEYYDEYLGFDDRGCFETALTRASRAVTSDVVASLIDQKAQLYAESAASGLTYFEGAIEAVRALAARWPVAVCSGALRSEIEAALTARGLDDVIVAIIAAEDTDRCKPDPEGYFLALDALRDAGHEDIEAGQCLAIEDSPAGIRAAKDAGMWALGVTHTYPAETLREAGADAVLEGLSGLDPASLIRLFVPEVSP